MGHPDSLDAIIAAERQKTADDRLFQVDLADAGWSKNEQIERIKARPTIMYWMVGALFLLGGAAFKEHAVALALAPVGAILGWAWLGENSKVTELAEHLRTDLADSLGRLAGDRAVLRRESRRLTARRRLTIKVIDLGMMLLLYIVPGVIGTCLWVRFDGHHGGVLWLAAIADMALVGVIAWQIIVVDAEVDWHLIRTHITTFAARLRRTPDGQP